MGQLRLTDLNMYVRIAQRSLSLRKTGSIQAANQNSKCRLLIISRVASLADDLPFAGALPFPDDPLAYVGRAIQQLNPF